MQRENTKALWCDYCRMLLRIKLQVTEDDFAASRSSFPLLRDNVNIVKYFLSKMKKT